MLTRLFGQISCNYWSKSFRKCGLDWKSVVKQFSWDLKSNKMCDFTDFVTFSNVRNDTCFVKTDFLRLKILLNARNSLQTSWNVGKMELLNRFFGLSEHFKPQKVCFTKQTCIVTSVAKSDEIGKIAHLVWLQISWDFTWELLKETL